MRALLLLILLAGCTIAPGPRIGSFRDPEVLLASKADFDPARFSGRWHRVARYPGGRACSDAVLDVAGDGPGLILRDTCGATDGRARVTGPGRLTLADGSESWVLWTDTGYRTAILVSPDGRTGQILNRAPTPPPDRLRAALEVLDFNGFDTDALIFAPESGN